jgi:hypothetical protein
MNGARRVTTAGAAKFQRSGADFGPDWPEVVKPFVVGRLNQAAIFM